MITRFPTFHKLTLFRIVKKKDLLCQNKTSPPSVAGLQKKMDGEDAVQQ